MNASPQDSKEIEIDLVLEAIFRRYKYDFRQYTRSSLKRRIERCLIKYRLRNGAEMAERISDDSDFFRTIIAELSVTVTEAFRDPLVFASIRNQVIPILRTYPFIKIWHAGCAGGEEAYSMAILLHEMGILERTVLYATDLNPDALSRAKEGVFAAKVLPLYRSNYQKSGGMRNFSNYYTEKSNSLCFRDFLRKKISFIQHNLVHDKSFGAMHMIICRNVLIYFNRELQTEVLKLFGNSLVNHGFLCLGSQENRKFIDPNRIYKPFLEKERIYRKSIRKIWYCLLLWLLEHLLVALIHFLVY